jgi:hypothetical protein
MKKTIPIVLIFLVWSYLLVPRAHAMISPETVSRAVSVFFKDAPVMVEVARCESGLRQYDEMGKALRGGYGNMMIGLFQLHEQFHRAEAKARGQNIDTLVGNMAYARDLYRTEGTTPWNSSAHCWQSAQHTSDPVTSVLALKTVSGSSTELIGAVHALTKNLSYGMRDAEVRTLQSALRKAGYPVVSEGEETEYFGIGTYKALRSFQCAQGIACITDRTNTSFGRVDARTRAVINSLLEKVS